MEINLVGESLKFMVLGMLVVFLFLYVMVQVMKLQAKIINKYFPEVEPIAPVSIRTINTVVENDSHHVAVIVAAITEFRKNKS